MLTNKWVTLCWLEEQLESLCKAVTLHCSVTHHQLQQQLPSDPILSVGRASFLGEENPNFSAFLWYLGAFLSYLEDKWHPLWVLGWLEVLDAAALLFTEVSSEKQHPFSPTTLRVTIPALPAPSITFLHYTMLALTSGRVSLLIKCDLSALR